MYTILRKVAWIEHCAAAGIADGLGREAAGDKHGIGFDRFFTTWANIPRRARWGRGPLMAVTLLFGCCQIETSARDLAGARSFFQNVLGGRSIEQELASQIDAIAPGTDYGCDHIGLGEAVFQINQPDARMVFNGHHSIHQTYLDRLGPCVTNLNFFIDDHVHARALLAEMGAPLHIDGPSSSARALGDYGPTNTRSGGDERPFMFFGTRSLIGLDLEIMEPNFLRFCDQTVQYPAFVHPRPAAGNERLLLERLCIVVPDLDETLRNLTRLFTPGSRSKPYAYRVGSQGRAFRIGLGGIEIEYCQPLDEQGELACLLDEYGPGVFTIDFAARDFDATLAECRRKVAISPEPNWLGIRDPSNCGVRLMSRDPIGFDAVLKPWPATTF